METLVRTLIILSIGFSMGFSEPVQLTLEIPQLKLDASYRNKFASDFFFCLSQVDTGCLRLNCSDAEYVDVYLNDRVLKSGIKICANLIKKNSEAPFLANIITIFNFMV